jgi:hypothetical protein
LLLMRLLLLSRRRGCGGGGHGTANVRLQLPLNSSRRRRARLLTRRGLVARVLSFADLMHRVKRKNSGNGITRRRRKPTCF